MSSINRVGKAAPERGRKQGLMNFAGMAKVVGMGVFFVLALRGCKEEVGLYPDASDCQRDNPPCGDSCETAYQRALARVDVDAPRYASAADCQDDFGGECQPLASGQFRPPLAGFMVPRGLDCDDVDWHGSHRLLYVGQRQSTPHYQRWVTREGANIANSHARSARVDAALLRDNQAQGSQFRPGGFGRSMRAFAARSSS